MIAKILGRIVYWYELWRYRHDPKYWDERIRRIEASPFMLNEQQRHIMWGLVVIVLILLFAGGCANWQFDEVSLTGRYDQTKYGVREYGVDGATGVEVTGTWRRKNSSE